MSPSDVCGFPMVFVGEMRSVGYVFDELAEQSGTDWMAGSPRGQLMSERSVYSL